MSDDDPKKREFQIASLNQHNIESYFSIKYCGTKKLAKLNKILRRLTPDDLSKLAKGMADDYRTEYFWDSLEYNFEKLFIHKL